MSCPGIDAPFAHLYSFGLQPPPGPGIGLVILIGHDDGVARLQPLAKCVGQNIGVLRRRRPEAHLVGVHPQHCGQPDTGLVHLLARHAAGVERSVGLHLAFAVEPLQPLGHKAAGITASGVFEEGLLLQSRFRRMPGTGLGRNQCQVSWRALNSRSPEASRQHREDGNGPPLGRPEPLMAKGDAPSVARSSIPSGSPST